MERQKYKADKTTAGRRHAGGDQLSQVDADVNTPLETIIFLEFGIHLRGLRWEGGVQTIIILDDFQVTHGHAWPSMVLERF